MNKRLAFYLDLLERTAWTAAQAGIGFAIEGEFSWAGVRNAALIAAIKVVLASRLPWTADDSGSTLPESVDPPADE